jgi:hypothetical protein
MSTPSDSPFYAFHLNYTPTARATSTLILELGTELTAEVEYTLRNTSPRTPHSNVLAVLAALIHTAEEEAHAEKEALRNAARRP